MMRIKKKVSNFFKIQKFIIIEGKNANKKAAKLIEALPNKLKSTLIKAQFINNRRWDIYTKKNLRIKLPEIGYKKAMNTFIDMGMISLSILPYI